MGNGDGDGEGCENEKEKEKKGKSGRFICAICYEEACPASEDLQSIAVCGHVFHELCLQQWLEYCPRGKKATCPLCKQSCCSKDIHRLFFQSAAELTQATTSLQQHSFCSDSDAQSLEVLQSTIRSLEGKLSVLKTALESSQAQINDANVQLSLSQGRLQKTEAARAEAIREKTQCKEAFMRIQEELKRSVEERSKLLERNNSMARDLAASKLVQELDLSEDDVIRLASVGRGTNKDAILETLSRSLVMRNRTYKDLLTRCNELGVSESQALRKFEKANEQLKRFKARIQELESKSEEKVNAALRSLCKLSSASALPPKEDEHAHHSSKNKMPKVKVVNGLDEPRKDFQMNPGAASDVSMNTSGCSQMKENVVSICEAKAMEVADADHTNVGQESSEAPFLDICKDFDVEVLAGMAMSLEEEEEQSSLSRAAVPLQIRKEAGLGANKRKLPSPNIMTEGCPNSSSSKWAMPMQSGHSNEKRVFSSGKGQGSFIFHGADGRGGQVKIFKPPSQPGLRVFENSSESWQRQIKRCKATQSGKHIGVQNGSNGLRLEHFFGK